MNLVLFSLIKCSYIDLNNSEWCTMAERNKLFFLKPYISKISDFCFPDIIKKFKMFTY